MKSCLVENVLANKPEGIQPASFRKSIYSTLRRKIRLDREKKDTRQLSFFFGIDYLNDDEYACVALLAVIEIQKQANEPVSIVEQKLIVGSAFLFGVSEDRTRYKAYLDSADSLEDLVWIGRRRLHEKNRRKYQEW